MDKLNKEKNNKSIDTRHRWHSFPAKYPPDIPETYINFFTKKGDLVFDPMSGSGTTLIEAQRLNRKSVGFDVDPLSIINIKGKFCTASLQDIIDEHSRIVNSIVDKSKALNQMFETRFTEKTKEFIRYWFPQDSINQLLALSNNILSISNEQIRDFFCLVLSATVITKHGNICYAADLAHTRPHKVSSKKIVLPIDEFEKKYSSIIKDYGLYYQINKQNAPVLIHGDARTLSLDSNSVDLVVTSPPYANNAIDYLRAHKFALVWLGYSIEQLAEIRKHMIGELALSRNSYQLPVRTLNTIETIMGKDNSKGRRLEKYFSDMLFMLEQIRRALKPGKHAILVVASSVINGIDVLTHECLIEIAQSLGLILDNIQERDIDRDKRMMPVSNGVKTNSQIESRMHTEFIIDFRKDK